jgi:hypothetical protein
MEKLTYSQAYDKIIHAYFRDEIKPLDARFCFCGTLCNNSEGWVLDTVGRKHRDFGQYKGDEYVRMERALLDAIKSTSNGYSTKKTNPAEYEDALFAGMCAALEVLKQIHIERGEVIDEVPVFTKRDLSKPSLHPLFEQILKPFK